MSRKDIFSLFTVCVIPIHLWSIYLILYDYSWVLEQFSLDMYVGYVSYALIAALVESIAATLFLLILGLLIPKIWLAAKKLSILAVIAFILSFWAAANQIFFLVLDSPPKILSWVLLRTPYHQNLGMGVLISIVTLSVALPIFFIIRRPALATKIDRIIGNLSVLAIFYLGLDLIGGIIILFRLVSSKT